MAIGYICCSVGRKREKGAAGLGMLRMMRSGEQRRKGRGMSVHLGDRLGLQRNVYTAWIAHIRLVYCIFSVVEVGGRAG